jgi:hypothetical protein
MSWFFRTNADGLSRKLLDRIDAEHPRQTPIGQYLPWWVTAVLARLFRRFPGVLAMTFNLIEAACENLPGESREDGKNAIAKLRRLFAENPDRVAAALREPEDHE